MPVPQRRVVAVAVNATATVGDITVEIDPASSVPTPPAGTIFINQEEVDSYLTANSGTAFKYTMDFVEALPVHISHAIVVNLVAGVHRPRSAGEAWLAFVRRQHLGSITFQGALPALYDTVHAGGTIRAHQTLDEVTGEKDPYVDCDPATFPNDSSLRGRMAVFSNGYVSVIWGHDDTRLWLCTKLDPVPVDDTTTVAVKQPSTVIRNSLDDSTKGGFTVVDIDLEVPVGGAWPPPLNFNDLLLQDFSCGSAFQITGPKYAVLRVIMDKTFGPLAESGYGFRSWFEAVGALTKVSFIATVGGGAHGAIGASYEGARIFTSQSYFQGGSEGNFAQNIGTVLTFSSTVFRGGGSGTAATVAGIEGGIVSPQDYSDGVVPTIIDAPGVGLLINESDAPYFASDQYGQLRVVNNVGSCIEVGPHAKADLSGLASGIKDGGGNLDVGFLVKGPKASLVLGTNTDVAGTNGDVQFDEDSSIWSYGQLTAFGPIVDADDNLVKR